MFGPAARFPYAPEPRYTPADAPKEMLRRCTTHLGIERTVIVQASCHGTDNAAMLDAIAVRPRSAIRGVAIVDDTFTDADYDRLHAGGVRGVRFNFVKHLGGAPDMNVFGRVIDRIRTRGWHLVLHLDAPDIMPLTPMMRALPLPFVIDHMGRVPAAAGVDQPPLRALLELAKLPNCWIKVCGAERISMPPYDASGADRAGSIVAARPSGCSGAPIFRIPMPRMRPTRPISSTSCHNMRADRAGAKAPAGGQSGAALWFQLIKRRQHRFGRRCTMRKLFALALLLALAPLGAAQAAWPDRPVRVDPAVRRRRRRRRHRAHSGR